MRTTITVDDKLWERAKEAAGVSESSEIVRMALRGLVAREAGRRLVALGGTMPNFDAAPRRRSSRRPNENE